METFWTKNYRYTLYFLRELTGVFIAFYCIYFLTRAMFNPALNFVRQRTLDFQIVSSIGLIAAVFHTITWLWVTVKISPTPLPKPLQIIGFLGLIAVWLGVSYFLLHFFYT